MWIGWADFKHAEHRIWETFEYRNGERNGLYIPYRDDATWGYYLQNEKFGHWHDRAAEGEYLAVAARGSGFCVTGTASSGPQSTKAGSRTAPSSCTTKTAG